MKRLIIIFALVAQSPNHIEAFPAPASGDARLEAAGALVKKTLTALPSWERDELARYETSELAALRLDIQACEDASSIDEFLIDVEQLKLDIAALVVFDSSLNSRYVI